MAVEERRAERYVNAIRRRGISIYDPIEIGDPELWIPTPELEALLKRGLIGVSLGGLPLRTRSKVLKGHVCEALGYPVPSSFKKTRPRFPGQLFDTYVQKANNLQIWNEEVAPTRRYVIVHVDRKGSIDKLKVVTGDRLALFDTTGTLTQKYQARLILTDERCELVVTQDTEVLRPLVRAGIDLRVTRSPLDDPSASELLPIAEIFARLRKLVGMCFEDSGSDQERNRGAALHEDVPVVVEK